MRLRTPIIVLALAAVVVSVPVLAQQADAPIAVPVQGAPAAAPAQAVPAQAPAQAAPKQASPVKTAPSGGKPGVAQTKPAGKVTVGKGGKQRGAAPQAGPPKPPKPPWMEFPLPNKKLLLDFTEATPDMIFNLFARTSGITIIKEPGFKNPLTISSARALPLKDAFELLSTVLELQGFEFQKRGNFLLVARKQPPPPPPQTGPPPQPPKAVTKVYPIKYASAKEVARVINEVFGAGSTDQNNNNQMQRFGFNPGMPQMMMGGMQGGAPPKVQKCSAEEYSNSVIVTAMEPDQADVKALIDSLDKAADTAMVSEIFKLKSVPADQAVSAVQEVLTANAPLGRGAGKQNNNGAQDYYYYYSFRSQNNKTNNQSVIAINQTNSILVVASKENMEIIRALVKNLDVPTDYTGTTFYVHLENAKAADVADILNKAFTKTNDNNGNSRYYFYYEDAQPNKSNSVPTDIDEKGNLVNIRDLAGKVNVIADPNTNSLIVVTMPSNMKMIREIVSNIDKIADQVMIETVIVEANLDKTTKLGIEWSFQQRQILNSAGSSGSGSTDYGLQSSTTALQGFKYTIGGTLYKAFLNTLETDSRFRVLSTPHIFTSNNVKAEINVSQKVPYIKNQEASSGGNLISNYDFLDVGVVLDVTPRIASSGEVAMEVKQTANDLQSFTSYGAPIVNQREATTTVSVKDGETVILGGIIRSTYNNTQNKIPLLGDIPLLGELFKSSSKEIQQTELVVLMTPHIVHSNSDAQRLRSMQEEKLSTGTKKSIDEQVGKPKP